MADPGYILTKDNVNFYKTRIIPLSEVDLWKEIEDKGQK
jgi:hypothetical protein